MSGFVHLHNHSEYSLLDAIARIKDIAARCHELSFDAYALTDHGVMYGAMEFYTQMRKAELKPIVGCEVYVAPRKLTDRDPELDRRAFHLVLLAQNVTGYINLMKLCSIGNTEGFYYKPRVDVEAISRHHEGLIALTACPGGVVAGPFHRQGEQAAREAIERYLRIFGEERLFIEIQNHGIDIEEKYRPWAAAAAKDYGLRLVATNDNHYVHREDARPHDIALCLLDKKLLTDTDRKKYSGPDYYIKSEAEMRELFPEYPEAIENTRVVADMCNLELDLTQVHFPRFTIHSEEVDQLKRWVSLNPEQAGTTAEFGDTRDIPRLNGTLDQALAAGEMASTEETRAAFEAYLRKRTYEGAARRYGEVTPELRDRIEYELSVIIPKGFTTYFLICADFCNFSRSAGIPVGPGRGSAAGSVVAYCLEVTDLEPIKYGLYFERFLNPERIELPDFDIDFCYRRRDEVIEHVRRKYGVDRTAQIITYSRLKARAVIKAVGRAKGLEFQYTDRVTKEIHGVNPTIKEAVESSKQLQQMIASDPEYRELIEDSKRLEGIAAHHSVHAAGLVIGPEALPNFSPVQMQRDSDWLVTQYAMDTVPLTGLVKFDFLGLRNLTMIQDTVDFIRELEGEEIDMRTLRDDDPETYAMLQRGDGYGVFQFEAQQVKRMLQEAKPESITDLAAINAANRPGPLESGNTERYLKSRREGTAGESLYPSISEILASTGGQLLFQEQVMEIARKLGGFSLGEADVLRKAMGKKKFDVMAQQKIKFMAGIKERGIPEKEAESIWEMMEKFAAYGFNKAHSVCYSLISYHTAYLKCHYPHHFMSAMLNSYQGNSAKLAEILAQCRKMKIEVLPPSVNSGTLKFTPTREGKIIFGLVGIKGVGEAAVENIIKEYHTGGDYKAPEGFLARTKGKGMNKKVLQSLAVAGAFDCLGVDRLELIQNLDDIENFMRGPSKQEALFGDFEGDGGGGATPDSVVTPLDVAMLEKGAVGVFLTHHPFENHPMYSDKRYIQLKDLQSSVNHSPAQWQDRPLPSQGMAGLLTEVAPRMSRSKKMYANARLEDPERSLRLIIWPKTYEDNLAHIKDNQPVLIWGKVQLPETLEETMEAWESVEIVVDRIQPYPGGNDIPAAPDPAPVEVQQPSGNGHGGGNGYSQSAADTGDEDFVISEYPGGEYPDAQAGDTESPVGETDDFAPLPVMIRLRMCDTTKRQLSKLADKLEHIQGDREVQMVLHEISGDIRRVKLDPRFAISDEASEQLAREFPFITFLEGSTDEFHEGPGVN